MHAQIGSQIEITVSNDETVNRLTVDGQYRVPRRQILRGIVVGQPSWLQGPHVCLLNSETKVLNLVPQHRIVAINDKPVVQPTAIPDRVYQVASSKTGEQYTVRFDGMRRVWSCTCTGWQYHKRCRHCVRCELEAERLPAR